MLEGFYLDLKGLVAFLLDQGVLGVEECAQFRVPALIEAGFLGEVHDEVLGEGERRRNSILAGFDP